MQKILLFALVLTLGLSSCVSKKDYEALQAQLASEQDAMAKRNQELNRYAERLADCERRETQLQGQIQNAETQVRIREEQIDDLKKQRDQQVTQVGDLTVLSQGANQNINRTLAQLESKDKYIRLLQAAKSKADSINLALAVNLKQVLKDGIDDQDVDIKVDKTVVYINLSDKMLYKSGSYEITDRAGEVLAKIAAIAKSRPNLDLMVEGYTDNVAIKTACVKDNWDLSVLRSTSVVRTLQQNYGIDPNRLIASGRGEYNALVDNSTAENRATNRRTRIILLPRLNQFYDLLNPDNIPE
ncbi:OmpA family protein [Neolewinella lacunae]|uniref:OmpA family protein n=1 Tax=Neolewinella lacunae TaxID=1517758 RepID=A0A923PHT4_9BACT|nr:OmpA family protein [Neolewinella lacunae]MBC6994335.1 OmpA family protein [Neolewinella lacunae]MDN3635818.1 OmpA family protein [Neolewinella lacunae]